MKCIKFDPNYINRIRFQMRKKLRKKIKTGRKYIMMEIFL